MKIVILSAIYMIVYLSNMTLGKIVKQSNYIVSNEEFEPKFLQIRGNATKGKNATKPAAAGNSTAVGAAPSGHSIIIEKAPYMPSDCSETVLFKAKRLLHANDYANKKDAYFAMNAIRINIFDDKKPDSLVNSKRIPGLSTRVNILPGSKNCLFFQDSKTKSRNISMCIEDKNMTQQILRAYDFFHECSELVSKQVSEEDSLEKLLNTLDNPTQTVYKIPNFKRALTESLQESGFQVGESKSPEAKSNCKEDAVQHKFPQPKTIPTLADFVDYDNLHKLDKSIPIVPGVAPPTEEQQMAIQKHKSTNLKRN